jgi:predicted amidohydrolase
MTTDARFPTIVCAGPARRGQEGWGVLARRMSRLLWAVCLAGLVLVGLGRLRLWAQSPAGASVQAPAWLVRPAASLRVASVQMRSSPSLGENVARIRQHLQQCAQQQVRVAVFPECALTGYDGERIVRYTAEELAAAQAEVAQACRELGLYAVLGTPCRLAGKLYNTALVIDPAGRVIHRYHKIQLAEPWPEAGEELAVFPVDGVPCAIIICHDERYPELVRLPVLAGARVLFYLSHESGLHQEHKLGPYRAQIQARAVENTIYVVQANAPANADATGSHGHSRLIAPDGNLIQEASIFGEELLVATLDIGQATRANALKSLTRGPLVDWWRQGLARVRIVEPPDAAELPALPGDRP